MNINLFIRNIIYLNHNCVKTLKYLKSKGINIYKKYRKKNPCAIAHIFNKRMLLPFLKNLYITNYTKGNKLYIYFVIYIIDFLYNII